MNIQKNNNKTIEWLLDSDDVSIRYRTLTELLDIPETDKKVSSLKRQISESKPVKDILDNMHPDGYWLQKKSTTGEMIGDAIEYGAFATTHFCLSYLAELGMTKESPEIAKACERYLNLQKEDGDYWNHMSCLTGYNIRTFIRLGYKNDFRIQRSINLLLYTNRFDNGYLCDMHEKRNKKSKSCIRGAVKVLLAFAELPEYWNHPRVKNLIDYFLKRDAIFKTADKNKIVNEDINRLSYPIIWRANIYEILYALSKMGYGKERRLERAWSHLEARQTNNGKYILDWTPVQCPWKIGKRKLENNWVTFYVLLAMKYK
ncbi:hypothetical protein KA977_02890 [Candidatus Dependentiae bacterium]|nr:hypothetical protein [Candidatus Dependentiae bacterium]